MLVEGAQVGGNSVSGSRYASKRGWDGFDPSKLRKVIQGVKDAYSDFEDALIKVTQDRFVTPISNLWCCQEAVDFFNKSFKPVLEELNKKSTTLFESIHVTVNEAGSDWARRTGNTGSWIKKAFVRNLKSIDVSKIKAQTSDGKIGISKEEAIDASGTLLTQTYTRCVTALNKLKNAVYVSGLFGGGQEEELQSLINRLQDVLSESVNKLATEIKTKISTTAEQYGTTATSVTTSISGVGAGVAAALGGLESLLAANRASTSTSHNASDMRQEQFDMRNRA